MAGLRTVMALVDMCCIPTNVLQWACNEAQGLSQFSCSVVSNSLRPHRLQHARLPCPSPTPEAYSNSCTLSRWCYPTISSSVVPFSVCLQISPASGAFPMSQFFASSSRSIGVSASAAVLPMNIQDWFPLGWTGWISLQSKGSQESSLTPQFKWIRDEKNPGKGNGGTSEMACCKNDQGSDSEQVSMWVTRMA